MRKEGEGGRVTKRMKEKEKERELVAKQKGGRGTKTYENL